MVETSTHKFALNVNGLHKDCTPRKTCLQLFLQVLNDAPGVFCARVVHADCVMRRCQLSYDRISCKRVRVLRVGRVCCRNTTTGNLPFATCGRRRIHSFPEATKLVEDATAIAFRESATVSLRFNTCNGDFCNTKYGSSFTLMLRLTVAMFDRRCLERPSKYVVGALFLPKNTLYSVGLATSRTKTSKNVPFSSCIHCVNGLCISDASRSLRSATADSKRKIDCITPDARSEMSVLLSAWSETP